MNNFPERTVVNPEEKIFAEAFTGQDVSLSHSSSKVSRRLEAQSKEHPLGTVDNLEPYGSSPSATTNQETTSKSIGPLLPPARKKTTANEHFKVLQKWEGYVVEVLEDSFVAQLRSISGSADKLETEIFLDELDQEDKNLTTPGAIFYWSIGYSDIPSGRRRTSLIRFKRAPRLTEYQLLKANEKAVELASILSDN